jgi:uncharacterized protein (TIRG00374 family)
VAIVPKVLKSITPKKLFHVVKFVVAGLLIWMLIQKIELTNVMNAFITAKFQFILIAFLLGFPNVLIQFLKWRFLLRLVKPTVSNYETLSSLLIGFTLGFITPGRIGEFGRAVFIHNCSRTRVVGLAMLDKLFPMGVVFLIGTWSVVYLLGSRWSTFTLAIFITLATAITFLVFWLSWYPQHLRRIMTFANQFMPYQERIELLLSSLDNFHRKQAIIMLGYSFVFYGIITSQFLCLMDAFEALPVFESFLTIFAIYVAKSLLPISLADLGVRETAAVFFFGLIGAAPSTAFNAAILIFLINLVFPSLAGFILLLNPAMNEQLLIFRKK